MVKKEHPPKKTKIETWCPPCYWGNEGHYNDIKEGAYAVIIFVLNADPLICPEIWYFCWVHGWSFLEKPPHMCKEKTSFDTIGIFHSISFCMVYTVIIGPGRCRASKTETTNNEVYIFYYWMCLVCFVREISMIARCDAHRRNDIYQTSSEKCNPIPRSIHKIKRCRDEKTSVNKNNKEYTGPLKTSDIFHAQIIYLSCASQNKKTWLWQ